MRWCFAALLLCLMFAPAGAQAPNDVLRAVTAQRLALRTLATEIAIEEGLDTTLALELVLRESDFRPRAVGKQGEIGLTQIKLGTARGLGFRGTREQLFEPRTNLRLGFRYAVKAIRHGGIRFYSTGF